MLDDGDGRDVSERLRGGDIRLLERAGIAAQQVERADDAATEPQGKRVGSVEPLGGSPEPVKPDETSVYDAFCAASPLGVAFGSLIQATVGSSGGSGLRCRKRAGFVVYAASSVSWRWARISAAVPKWTDAGV